MKRSRQFVHCVRFVTSSFLAACIFIGGSVSRAEQLTVIPSDQANKSAYVTNKGIRWYTSLEDAETEAKKEGKLVFWLHMLGTIDGST